MYDFVLQPNSTAVMDADHDGGAVTLTGALTAPDLNSVTITVNGMSSITKAQWRVPVQH